MTLDIRTPRYTDLPFPEWRYHPGTGMARPGKDSAGPHMPRLSPPAAAFDAADWPASKRYLYAVDLFNHRYWWEAHEVLEDLWIEAGRKTAAGRFIQGIIQISAALLKASRSHPGTLRLAAKGLAKIRLQPGIFLGVDTREFGRQVEAYIRRESQAPPEIELRVSAQSGFPSVAD